MKPKAKQDYFGALKGIGPFTKADELEAPGRKEKRTSYTRQKKTVNG